MFFKRTQMVKLLLALVLLLTGKLLQAQAILPVHEPDSTGTLAFKTVPDSIAVTTGFLDSVFQKKPGDMLPINSSDVNKIEGRLKSIVSRNDNTLFTAMITLSGLENTVFALSRIVIEPGVVRYHGTVIGKQLGDCFELIQTGPQYYLIKKNINSLRAE